MQPVLFSIGPVSVYAWGTMLSLAVIVGVVGARRLAIRAGIDPDRILDLAIWLILAGLIGARLFYVFFYDWQFFSAYPLEIIKLNQPGLVYYGGLLGGIAAGGGYVYRYRLPFWNLADVVAPFLALGYGIVRIGCFLNGCCFGKPTDLPWGVVFPGLLEISRHPTQLYSAGLALLLFGMLIWLFCRRKFPGQVFLVYLMVYAVMRAVVEVFRENLLVLGPITIAQLVSLGLFLVAAVTYVYLRNRARRTGSLFR
ncbi:MAG: prolipoprotein diacylglyceryl transferase [Syntrophomonadaceae bacterium]|nr:prolipoprotein diacylglyceryl transferase [Syntrophomonadaceae bacterium]